MDPRIILTKLIERLEPELGRYSPGESGGWEGEEDVVRERGASGRLCLIEAVLQARRALKSGDPTRIAEAALVAPTFERKGRAMQANYVVQTKRKNGGKKRGAEQAAAAEQAWAPYKAQFDALVSGGKSMAFAHYIVRERWKAMNPDKLVPSDKTFRSRLRRKSEPS
ncbi:MAG: hypothetical protein AB7P02_01540 [Alphaproteobacteria bacterium]